MIGFGWSNRVHWARRGLAVASWLTVSGLSLALAGCGSSTPHANGAAGSGAGDTTNGGKSSSSGGDSAAGSTVSNAGAATEAGAQGVGGSSAGQPAGAAGEPSTGDWPAADIPKVGTAGVTYLSDLPWKTAVVYSDFGAAGSDSPIGKDRTVTGKTPLVINGVAYAKGLGVKTYTEITYDISAGYKQFVADTGLDFQENSETMIFEVKLDDELVYDGGDKTSTKDQVEHVTLDVTGKKTMLLYVRDGFDDKTDDFGIWGGARLVK